MALNKTLRDLAEDARRRGLVSEIDPDGLARLREDEGEAVVVIDVRESAERQREGAVPGSVGVPRGVLERDVEKTAFGGEASDADLDRPVVLYCGGGSRSLLAGEALVSMGFRRVYSLCGGFRGYAKSGRTLA